MADVLVAVGGMDLGGIETFIMNVYRKIDPGFVRFDFLLPHDRNYFFADDIRDRGGRLDFIDESGCAGKVGVSRPAEMLA